MHSLKQTLNPVEIEITTNDPDGSETFVFQIIGPLPNTTVNGTTYFTQIFGESGNEIIPVNDVYTLSEADVDEFALLPPLHYSSILQGDIVLETTTVVTDGDSTATFDLNITVDIEGVADQSPTRNITVFGVEDEVYDIGAVLVPELDGVLIDVSDHQGGPTVSNPVI